MGVLISVNDPTNLVGIVQVTVSTNPVADSVSLYKDSETTANRIGVDTTPPSFTFSWDTRTVSDGPHNLICAAVYKNNIKRMTLPVQVKNAVAPPPPPPPPPPPGVPAVISAPTISGTAQQGLVLDNNNGTWTNNPTSYTYQWVRCDSGGLNPANISGATSKTYTLVLADVGSTIRVAVKGVNTVGPATTASTSAQTGVVAPLPGSPPVKQTAPTIGGTLIEGYTLTISNGTWSPAATSYQRRWVRCDGAGQNCIDPVNNTGETYVLTAADVGKTIRCWTTAFNASGGSAPEQSAATEVIAPAAPVAPPGAPVNTVVPVISVVGGGAPTVGKTLSVNSGTWQNNPTTFWVEWIRCDSQGTNCVSVTGTSGSTLFLTDVDLNKRITCWTAAQNVYGTGYVRSALTAVVGAGTPGSGQTFDKYAAPPTASPPGNDNNPGTLAAPYATFMKLITSLSAGQTGALRQGNYGSISTEHWVQVGGNVGSPITISGYPGETATLKGRLIIEGDNITFKNFKIDGSNDLYDGTACGDNHTAPIGIYASNIIFDHIEYYQSVASTRHSAFYQGSGSGLIIRYCKIHDIGSCYHFDHGVYFGSGSNADAHHNWIWNNNYGWGAHFYPETSGSRFHHNIVYNCGAGVIYSGNAGCNNNQSYNNVIANSSGCYAQDGSFTTGAGIAGWPPLAGTNNSFTNNCCWNNPGGIGSQANVSITGNFIADPLFVNAGAADFRIQAGSPVASWGLWDGT